jgi:UDP-N-acetylglucosamine transferase subunit ALG13
MEYNNKILVVASAGGHLTQALCATSACDNIALVCNKKNISSDKIKCIYKIWATQHNPFIHFVNIFYALYVLFLEQPKIVFSTGGPIVLPFALVCKLMPIKFVYLDTLSRVVELSNTGQLIKKYNLFDEFFCQWSDVAKKNDVKYIGKSFDILGENKFEYQTVPLKTPPIILVTVGTNQYKFDRLFEMLYQHPLYNNPAVEWIIQANHNVITTQPANGKVLSMIDRDEMDVLVKQASLVISHCGIGSINLMLAYQKRVVFVPRLAKFDEFSDDHQLQIANELSGPIFDVVGESQTIPEISFTDLTKFSILSSPVDTTNHSMALKLKDIFF